MLAYVDDLLIVGDSEQSREFIEVHGSLSQELLVKITGLLEPGAEHSFLGHLKHNGDSIDMFTWQGYIDE